MTTGQAETWLAGTTFYELTSSGGLTFGVWVTVPMTYEMTDAPLPVVYVTDGNWTVGMTAPLITIQQDVLQPIAPYIQVAIGYAGEEAAGWAQLRNRDLVPAGEPIADEMVAVLKRSVESGAMSQEAADAYLAELTGTNAEAFLRFIVDDLHPFVAQNYRVADTGHGLFGYSYGGLFSLYAWLRRTSLFATIGAGSPGIATARSRVFDLFAEASADATADGFPQLHLTFNELEMLGNQAVYRELVRNTLTFVAALEASAIAPQLSTKVLQDSHMTGVTSSFLSYMRTLRAA